MVLTMVGDSLLKDLNTSLVWGNDLRFSEMCSRAAQPRGDTTCSLCPFWVGLIFTAPPSSLKNHPKPAEEINLPFLSLSTCITTVIIWVTPGLCVLSVAWLPEAEVVPGASEHLCSHWSREEEQLTRAALLGEQMAVKPAACLSVSPGPRAWDSIWASMGQRCLFLDVVAVIWNQRTQSSPDISCCLAPLQSGQSGFVWKFGAELSLEIWGWAHWVCSGAHAFVCLCKGCCDEVVHRTPVMLPGFETMCDHPG